jgi:hypothetical protein
MNFAATLTAILLLAPPDSNWECMSGTPDTKLRPVGRIDRFMVYDLESYFSPEVDADAVERKVDRKSILVQSGPGQFHEIYVNEMGSPLAAIYPTRIVKSGRQRILVSKSDDGGNAGIQYLDAFLILPNGSVHLDFTPVYEAAKKLVPKGRQLWNPASNFDFEKLEWRSGTNTDHGGKVGCCVGEVTVKFQIEPNGIVTAGGAIFRPTPTP